MKPANDAYGLVIRGIEAIETMKGQIVAMEKSLDSLRIEVAAAQARLARVDSFLAKLARSEDERAKTLRVEADRRDAWFTRLWASPAVQILTIAAVCGLMQLFGVQWLIETLVNRLVPGVAP